MNTPLLPVNLPALDERARYLIDCIGIVKPDSKNIRSAPEVIVERADIVRRSWFAFAASEVAGELDRLASYLERYAGKDIEVDGVLDILHQRAMEYRTEGHPGDSAE